MAHFKIDEADLNDIEVMVKRFKDPDRLVAFRIWPSDVENKIGLYVSPIHLGQCLDPESGFAEFKDDSVREAFIASLTRKLTEAKIKFEIDREIGPRLLKLWKDIKEKQQSGR